MFYPIVEYTSLPICVIMHLEIHEKGLLVTSEISPGYVIDGCVPPDLEGGGG